MQDLCRMKLDWDEKIDLEILARWEKWRSQLSALEDFSMDRCKIPDGLVLSCQDKFTISRTLVTLVMVR